MTNRITMDKKISKEKLELALIDLFLYKPMEAWYSWIPTNFNSLEYDFIGEESCKTKFLYKNANSNEGTSNIFNVDFKPQLSDKMGLQIHEVFLNSPGQMRPISCVELEFKEGKYIGNVSVVFLEKEQYNLLLKKHVEMLKKRKRQAIYSSKVNISSSQHKDSIYEPLKVYQKCINEENVLKNILEKKLASVLLKGNFEVECNGIFKIEDLCLQALSVSESNIETILETNFPISVQTENSLRRETQEDRFNISVQALYTIVKRLFHKDNHHDAKIDDIVS